MGLICTLRFAWHRLRSCPPLPHFFQIPRHSFRVPSAPCLEKFSHLVYHSVQISRCDGSRYQPYRPAPTSAVLHFVGGAWFAGSCIHSLEKCSDFDGKAGRRHYSSWCTKDGQDSKVVKHVEGLRNVLPTQLLTVKLSEHNVPVDMFENRKSFGPSREKLHWRELTIKNLVLKISDLSDVKFVGRVLSEWIRAFAARRDIPYFLENHGAYSDENQPTVSRFVPYDEIARVVNAVIRELGESRNQESALEVLKWMESQGWCRLDPHLYTTVISILSESGCLDLAEKIFERLEGSEIRKDVALYNSLLSVRGRAGHIEAVEDFFEFMKGSACQPDLVSYNTVMNAYVKAGMGLGTVVEMFKDMYLQGIQPDLISFNILLEACISGQHVKEAEKIFDNLKARGLKPSVVTYTTLITLYGNAGQCTVAMQLFGEMLAADSQPNTLTYSSLVTACARGGLFEEAEGLFQSMKNFRVAPNVTTFNAMIHMYSVLGDCDKAQQMFRMLTQDGLKPTAVTYTSLMSCYKVVGAYKEVIDIYRQAKAECICDVYVYTEAIDACIKWRRLQNIVEIQSDMKAGGCSPDIFTCSIVLGALGSHCDSAEEACLLVNFFQCFDSSLVVYSRQMLLEIMPGDHEVNQSILNLFSHLDKEELKTWTVFSSALVDALWTLGWCRRAALVVAWVMERGVFNDICVIAPNEWKLDLRRLSTGAALVAFYQWMSHLLLVARQVGKRDGADVASQLMDGRSLSIESENVETSQGTPDHENETFTEVDVLLPLLPLIAEDGGNQSAGKDRLLNPKLVTIVTGWGKLSKQEGASVVKAVVQKEILKLRAPMCPSLDLGRWVARGQALALWLLEPDTAQRLALSDAAAEGEIAE